MTSRLPARMQTQPYTTLVEGRKFVDSGRKTKNGVFCPCCDIPQKMERTPLDCGMARTLRLCFWSCLHTKSYVINPHSLLKKDGLYEVVGGKWAKMRHWGLIHFNGSPQHGLCMMTDLGMSFAGGKCRVAGHAFIAINEFFGLDTSSTVDIHEALGKKYDAADHWQAIPEHLKGLVADQPLRLQGEHP